MDLIKSIFKGDKVIWIIFLFLCLISIIEVFSAASTLTYKAETTGIRLPNIVYSC